MKRNAYKTILVFIVLTMFGSAGASAQESHLPGDKKATAQVSKKRAENLPIDMLKIDTSVKMQEPHHVLSMAYRQTIRIFAQALLDQAQGGGALSADFARALVAEMNRNFDNAEDHYKDHLKPMSAGGRFMTASMMKEMDIYRSRLKDAIKVLEKDVANYTMNPKQIATDSASVIKHLDEISEMYKRE